MISFLSELFLEVFLANSSTLFLKELLLLAVQVRVTFITLNSSDHLCLMLNKRTYTLFVTRVDSG